VKRLQHELRDYHEQKRQQYEAEMKKDRMSATAVPQPLADSA
jgi:ribosomal protein L13E